MTDNLDPPEGQDPLSLNRRGFLRTGLGGALFLGTDKCNRWPERLCDSTGGPAWRR